MANKMTKAQKFEVIAKAIADAQMELGFDAQEFLAHEIELIANKKSTKSESKTQKENKEVKEKILAVLDGSVGMTATEVATIVGIAPNKATALLGQLGGSPKTKTEDKVVRFMDGKSPKFKLA